MKKRAELPSVIVGNKVNRRSQTPLKIRKGHLDSWKQIARYLGREVRTVQRWEKREGLPVHRQFHVKASTVHAFRHEIDAWVENRCHVFNRAALNMRRPDDAMDWSGPAMLVAELTRRSCGLWLVAAPNSRRILNDSSRRRSALMGGEKVAGTTGSVESQGDHGVDARGTPCRDVGGEHGDEQQDQRGDC